jgi:3-dehydroquinate dehydratase-1
LAKVRIGLCRFFLKRVKQNADSGRLFQVASLAVLMGRNMKGEFNKTIGHPLVVGTIHSNGALKRALRLKEGAVDILELRVDAFAQDPRPLLRAIPKLPAPLLLTVRHPKEGAMGVLSLAERRELFRQFLPLCEWVDVELRSLEVLEGEISSARAMGVKVIVSDHHFSGTPTLGVLGRRLKLAQRVKPDVVKVAATAETPGDLGRLFDLLIQGPRNRMAVMGMGAQGKVSRLLLGASGSVLNYGYLHEALVPGQWEATVLKTRLLELKANDGGAGVWEKR